MAQKQLTASQLLSSKEIADPQLVIDELFDFAHLPEIRELLWEWLKVTVTGTYHKELNASERSTILTLYEKLSKLVEAAHVMHTNPKRKTGNKIAHK